MNIHELHWIWFSLIVESNIVRVIFPTEIVIQHGDTKFGAYRMRSRTIVLNIDRKYGHLNPIESFCDWCIQSFYPNCPKLKGTSDWVLLALICLDCLQNYSTHKSSSFIISLWIHIFVNCNHVNNHWFEINLSMSSAPSIFQIFCHSRGYNLINISIQTLHVRVLGTQNDIQRASINFRSFISQITSKSYA